MNNLMERLDNLRKLIQEPDFLEGKGLSNEVNIRIFCYDPKEEMAVRHFTEKLVVDQNLGCHLVEYNLYKVFLSVCDKRHLTDRIPALEAQKGKRYTLEQLIGGSGKRGPAGIEAIADVIRNESHERGDVILITGVGEVFPFIRLHALLDTLQKQRFNVPILAMYPGCYDGRYVRLFEVLPPNPYYRAFNEI